MPNPWAPRRIDGDGGGSSKRLSVARPRRRRARPNAPCAMLHRGDAGILRSLSLMIPSSPRLVAFAQSECDLTTPSVCQSVVPNLGAQKRALQAPSNGVPNFSTGRRGFHVTAPRLALLRSKSRRRRAPRPAAGPPTHAIAGTRARAVTMAIVRPPSLLNHSRRLASCRAPRHCRLSTPPSSRDGGIE